jgi:RNA polymerase sigma-70 factor, ECF subfamily
VPVTIEALFSDYVGFVWRSLRQLGVAEADLEDQTQEVFIVVHRQLAQYDVQHPRAWLYGIARRCASGYRRRSHRRHECPVDTLPESSDTTDPSARAELDLLSRVLASLDEQQQEVFVLYEFEEMSMREVAEALQCPLQTAYTRLHAARRELARALEEAT